MSITRTQRRRGGASRRRRLALAGAAVALSTAAAVALPPEAASAQEAAPAVAGVGGGGAIAALLQQAEFWRGQNRPEMALRALERVLAVDPGHVEALSGAAAVQAQLGNRTAAETHLARLRTLAPQDPRTGRAAVAMRQAAIDPAALAEARRLAREGRPADAAARYRALFGGDTPPEPYAAEYYATLAGTPQGAAEGREGLARLAARAPGDARLQMQHAQALTWREETRAEGITRLRGLADHPEVGTAAAAAWRQAVLWLGPNPAAVPEIEALRQRFPADAQLARRLEEAQAPPAAADPGGLARQRGFERLNANRLRDAVAEFESALARDPRDADALGGLGIVRLREGRTAEAQALLERAIAAAPARRPQWQRALEGASYGAELAEARAAFRRGEAETAEAALRRAVRRDVPDRADAEALLGDIALRRGDAQGAETRYRAALARRPDFGPALEGLQGALRRQGRTTEVEEIARRTARRGGGGEGGRALALREEARRAADPETAAAILRNAMAQDPANPWVRLDLARALLRQGRAAEARALVEAPLGGTGQPPAEAAFAAALLAEEDNRLADAAALLERVPARQRSADMTRLMARARAVDEVQAAAAAGRGIEARQRLLAIVARPGTGAATAAPAVRALGAMGDPQGAAEAARLAQATARDTSPGGRLALAAALLDAGAEAEALSLAAAVEADPRLSAEQRRQAGALRNGFAVRTADRLNEQGDHAGAYDQLAPVLARDPGDTGANLALARLYQGARQPEQARQIAEAVLARDPRNLDARLAAAEAATAAGDRARAETLLMEARSLHPTDARVSLLEARIARAAGDERRAMRALQAAAEQRRAQLGQDAAAFAAPGRDVPLAPGARHAVHVPGAGGNPFRTVAFTGGTGGTGSGIPPQDRIAAEIARELAAAREEAAPRFQAGVALRGRSGTAGLDRLQEVSGTFEGSISPGSLGGRLALRVSPTTISSGKIGGGTEPLTRLLAPRDDSASGVAVGAAYTGRSFSADLGTTPLGFRATNIVGGVEFAPRLTDNLRLRLTAERRAVTDSLLSWAGSRDPVTGRTWGGVVRTGGRAQIEHTTGPVTLYAGGGYSVLEGENVARNTRLEANAGATYAVIRRPDEELTAGLDLTYFAYDRNLRHFSLGHGGYFSPQSYWQVSLPVDYRRRSGDLSWRLGATIGYANWREDDAPVFPDDAGLQRRLETMSALVAPLGVGVPTRYAGQSRGELTGGLRADIEYAVTPALRLGALLRYDRSAEWNEARGLLYARYRLGEP